MRAAAANLPVEEAISLIGGAQDFLSDPSGILGDLLDQAGDLLP
jgi:hypothetical protein